MLKLKPSTYDDGILANVHKGTNYGRRDHSALAYKDMIANVHGKEGDAFAKLFIGRSYHRVFANHTIPSGTHIGQIAAYYGPALYNHLAIEHNILGAAEHRVAAHLIAGCLEATIDEVIGAKQID